MRGVGVHLSIQMTRITKASESSNVRGIVQKCCPAVSVRHMPQKHGSSTELLKRSCAFVIKSVARDGKMSNRRRSFSQQGSLTFFRCVVSGTLYLKTLPDNQFRMLFVGFFLFLFFSQKHLAHSSLNTVAHENESSLKSTGMRHLDAQSKSAGDLCFPFPPFNRRRDCTRQTNRRCESVQSFDAQMRLTAV